MAEQYVPTRALRDAIRGHEQAILAALGIELPTSGTHRTCPFPDHDDQRPSWRWDEGKARAFCTCTDGHSLSILDVIQRATGLEFEAAKLRAAEILGRPDLITEPVATMTTENLLAPPPGQADPELPRQYLAHRLGIESGDVIMPSTPAVGWRSLPYYDPPEKRGGKPKLLGRYPCVVFGTVAPDGRIHAHRIYVAPGGHGKADLGVAPDGRCREAKKSAMLPPGASAPTGTTADTQRLHREADRLFRAAGNRSGRSRMRADGGSRPTYYPRGLIISTGEDIPSGQSLRARLLVLELAPGEIRADALSAAQADAAAGRFAAAMTGYLRWLAPQMDHLKDILPPRHRALRDGLVESGQHRRTPDIAANLILGWELFLRLAQETGALGRDDAMHTLAHVRSALTDSAERQSAHQASEEPATRFLALLGAAISSGRAHVADADTGLQPGNAGCWGWQLNVVGSGDYDRNAWRANGERLGWTRDGELLLDPEAAFAAAQKLARDQGTSIPIKQRTLWKRLAEQGLLASRDLARGTNTVRRTIQGLRRDLLHLRTSTLAAQTDQRGDETDQRAETDQEKGPQCRGFPGPGQFGQFGQKVEPRGPSKPDLRDAVGWEVEI